PVRTRFVTSCSRKQMVKPPLCIFTRLDRLIDSALKGGNVLAVLIAKHICGLSQDRDRVADALMLLVDDSGDFLAKQLLRAFDYLFFIEVNGARIVSPLLWVLFVVAKLAHLPLNRRP